MFAWPLVLDLTVCVWWHETQWVFPVDICAEKRRKCNNELRPEMYEKLGEMDIGCGSGSGDFLNSAGLGF